MMPIRRPLPETAVFNQIAFQDILHYAFMSNLTGYRSGLKKKQHAASEVLVRITLPTYVVDQVVTRYQGRKRFLASRVFVSTELYPFVRFKKQIVMVSGRRCRQQEDTNRYHYPA